MSDIEDDINYVSVGDVDTMDETVFECPIRTCVHTYNLPIDGDGITKTNFTCCCYVYIMRQEFAFFTCRNCRNFHTTLQKS
jgi:hypothetical protein